MDNSNYILAGINSPSGLFIQNKSLAQSDCTDVKKHTKVSTNLIVMTNDCNVFIVHSAEVRS